MTSVLDKYREAGFSDSEINEEVAKERTQYKEAGFSEDEIDAHYGLRNPIVPQAFKARVLNGTAQARVIKQVIQGFEEGWGKDPIISDKDLESLRRVGIFRDPDTQTGLANAAFSGVRGANELMIGAGASALNILMRLPGAVTGAIGAGVGQIAEEKGIEQGMAGRLGRDIKSLGDISMIVAGSEPFARTSRGPDGRPVDQVVGRLPERDDFVTASEGYANVQKKLDKLWEEHGIHPAEVAADLRSDPVLAQELLSTDTNLPRRYVEAFHGSPIDFEAFDIGKIGTGEGAQSFGHGLYFAENADVATSYRDRLAGGKTDADLTAEAWIKEAKGDRQEALRLYEDVIKYTPEHLRDIPLEDQIKDSIKNPPGQLYEVRIAADKNHFLDWDKPYREQSEFVREALDRALEIVEKETGVRQARPGDFTGEEIMRSLWSLGKDRASEILSEAGIPGVRYLDQGSRAEGAGSHNFVVFDDKLIEITAKNGEALRGPEKKAFVEDRLPVPTEGGKPQRLQPILEGMSPEDAARYERSGTIRLYRGESGSMMGSVEGGGWYSTNPEKARLYGEVHYIDATREDMKHFAQGAGGSDEWVALEPEAISHLKRTPLPPAEPPAGGPPAKPPAGGPPAEPPKAGLPAEPLPPGEPPLKMSYDEARKAILDRISIGAPEPGRKLTWEQFYTNIIDELHPIKKYGQDIYEQARLTRGQYGRAEHFLEYGTFDFNTYKSNGRSLETILGPVKEDLDGFRAFLAAKRSREIEARGKKSGFGDISEAARVVIEDNPRRGTFEEAAAQINAYNNNLLKYLKDSGVLSQKSWETMIDASQNYVPFYRLMEDWQVAQEKGGKGFGPSNPVKRLKGSEKEIVDPLESIIKNTYAYISIADRNAVGIQIVDILREGKYRETYERVESKPTDEGPVVRDAATGEELPALRDGRRRLETDFPKGPEKLLEKPDVSELESAPIKEFLKDYGIEKPSEDLIAVIRTLLEPEQYGNTISAFRDGKRETVGTTDVELVRAFKALDRESANMLTKVLGAPARALRAGATLSPELMTKNIDRDFFTAFVNSKGIFSPIDTARGLKSVIAKDQSFQDWLKSGGANATLVSLDRRYMQESLQQLTAETGLMDRSWNVIKSPFGSTMNGLRAIAETAENATRLGEFKKFQAETKAEMLKAGYASREVTVDFARKGASMMSYNMITAFANAQIQGVDRMARAFIDRPVGTTARVAAGITLPSVLLWWANHEDERYKSLPRWEKDLFWHILTDKWEDIGPEAQYGPPAPGLPQRVVNGVLQQNNGHIFRVPKPFELGVIFGSGAERLMESFFGENPDAFKEFSKSLVDALIPSLVPTIAQPVIEQWGNQSTFLNRGLIPKYLEKELPEYQYTPYTTELTKTIGGLIGAFPGIRTESLDKESPLGGVARALSTPILLDNYLRGWTGGLGQHALNLADAGLRKAGVIPDPVKPEVTLADIPYVRAFVSRYPSANTQQIQDFYQEYEKTERLLFSWTKRAEEGDMKAVDKIQAFGGEAMFLKMDAIKQTLGEHSKLIRDIHKNPEISREEKRQLIDQLYYSMIQLGIAGKDAMRQAKE